MKNYRPNDQRGNEFEIKVLNITYSKKRGEPVFPDQK